MSDSDQSASRRSRSHHSGDSSVATESQSDIRSGRKEATHWKLEEETTLLRYLYDNRSGTDGTTLPKRIYTGASAHLAEVFKKQKGGAKTYSACKTKFSSLKKAYLTTQALKVSGSSSGFTWTQEGGATIDKDTASTWAGYVKSNPNAKQFKNKGFKHFEIFNLLMANMQAKGIHIRWRKNRASSVASATSMPPPSMIMSY
ncbi:hypothetical protein BDR07DRAFT_1371126 [Suillus spraguei]|nr:hypothetical protein BDR07DRAFT_1371126 [Suillus spraguei]